MNPMEIQQIQHLPPQIHVLEEVAFTEGFRFLTRLISEWQSGDNRFDAPGECLMAAYLNHELVGVGGLQSIHMRRPIPEDCGVCTWRLLQGGNTLARGW